MRKLSRGRRIALGALAVVAVFMLTTAESCDGSSTADQQRERSVDSRAQNFSKAEKVAPLPKSVNFPIRKALVAFTERQDMIDHPWYVYILADTGNMIGYYVAKTVPINACDFLSSTEDVRSPEDEGNVVLTAPSLDGVFYGGGGASAGCDAWFFFDSATNALVQIRGVNFYTADQPLRVEAKPIRVRAK